MVFKNQPICISVSDKSLLQGEGWLKIFEIEKVWRLRSIDKIHAILLGNSVTFFCFANVVLLFSPGMHKTLFYQMNSRIHVVESVYAIQETKIKLH